MPPEPSGRTGRYRPRKRSFASAVEDTLRSYGFPAEFPFLARRAATCGRAMDTPDDDLEFDFFEDEPATTEAQSQSRVRLPRRGGRGPGVRRPAGPPRGMTPLLRLLALVAILVAALVFFGLLIQSCASTSKHDTYQSYVNQAA